MRQLWIGLILIAGLLFTVYAVMLAHANGEYEYEGFERGDLGEAAAWLAGFASVQYFVVRRAITMLRGSLEPRLLARLSRLSLDAHSYGNLAAFALGFLHGYPVLSIASPLEYSMIALAVVLTASGITMRYLRSRRAKLVARMVHGQRVLALILLVLVLIHAERMD